MPCWHCNVLYFLCFPLAWGRLAVSPVEGQDSSVSEWMPAHGWVEALPRGKLPSQGLDRGGRRGRGEGQGGQENTGETDSREAIGKKSIRKEHQREEISLDISNEVAVGWQGKRTESAKLGDPTQKGLR